MRPILLARRRALPARPRGAALLTAMILVTVVATLAAGMLWQQWRALQVEAAERTQTQAQWLLQGAMDLIGDCACLGGCPACVGPVLAADEVRERSPKMAGLTVLHLLAQAR